MSLLGQLGGIRGKQAVVSAGWHCAVRAVPFLRNADATLQAAEQMLLPTGTSPSPAASSRQCTLILAYVAVLA